MHKNSENIDKHIFGGWAYMVRPTTSKSPPPDVLFVRGGGIYRFDSLQRSGDVPGHVRYSSNFFSQIHDIVIRSHPHRATTNTPPSECSKGR